MSLGPLEFNIEGHKYLLSNGKGFLVQPFDCREQPDLNGRK